jgi:hypothetical protein
MKFLSHIKLYLLTGIVLVFSSCFKDLDTIPLDDDEFTSAIVYEDPTSYKKVLAKLYAGLALTGQQGPAGQADISGIDEGFGQYLRMYWYAQELSTDEAVIGWNDATIKNFHNQNWDADDGFLFALYSRIFYQVAICNEFLRESTDEKLDARGQSNLKAEVKPYRAEARFLRALSYWHALDLFRTVPFVTEEDAVGSFFPKQISAAELYAYIESELKAIEPDLLDPRSEYGRADKAAAWTLLAKLYLNAQQYVNKPAWSECIEACNKVIAAGYTLDPDYQHLFLADNETADGVIFPIAFDGDRTRTWGGTTFLVHAPIGGSMNTADFGVDFGWGGLRTTSAFVDKFPEPVPGDLTPIVTPKPDSDTYPVLQLPGSYQGWKPEDAATVKLVASVAGDNKYDGYAYFESGTEFKITQGGTWDVNWGDTGADGTLDAGGDNFKVTETGFYRLRADLDALTYTFEKTDWGLIGSATPGMWDSDQDLTYNTATGALEITIDLVAGEIKFRANDAWDLNYGDTGNDVQLEEGGDNIKIDAPGTYLIQLFLDKPNHTYGYGILEPTSADGRRLFYTDGQSRDINDLTLFTDGYAIAKWKNITSTGQKGKNETHVDTDFPMFRIEDVYLMYAEAVLNGGSGGDAATALGYVNEIRQRAYGSSAGNISSSDLTLDFILDERARELYWEGHRRTDLVRHGKFSESSYIWPWKGGVPEGVSVEKCRDVFPIPSSDLSANPNLVQNEPGCY